MMIRPAFSRLLIALVALGAFFVDASPRPPRLNILLISLCSLRQQNLQAYGYPRDTSPNLLEFSRDAFVFENGHGNTSWLNAFVYMRKHATGLFEDHGYRPVGNSLGPIEIDSNAYFHIDSRENRKEEITRILKYVKGMVDKPSDKPFFTAVHFKLMHFPYSGSNRGDFDHTRYFSPRSRELYQRYDSWRGYKSNDPRVSSKLPVLALLFGDKQELGASPNLSDAVSNVRQNPFGLINNQELLARWRKTPDYVDDLQLLRDAYDAKLRFMDEMIAPLLRAFDDSRYRDNTVVIVTGDHGDAFMEHGTLLHGQDVYDESLRFPLMVRFPGQKGQVRIADQVSHKSTGGIIGSLMRGSLTQRNFAAGARRHADSLIVARNCMSTAGSARLSNRWKLISNVTSGSRELYDLRTDPGETVNLFEKHPEIAGPLEEALEASLLSLQESRHRRGWRCWIAPQLR